MSKTIGVAIGGVMVVGAGAVYLLSSDSQQKKYRQAFHDGVAGTVKETVKQVTSRGLFLLIGGFLAKTR